MSSQFNIFFNNEIVQISFFSYIEKAKYSLYVFSYKRITFANKPAS